MQAQGEAGEREDPGLKLNQEQIAAAVMYSAQMIRRKSLFEVMNKFLREKNRGKAQPGQPLSRVLGNICVAFLFNFFLQSFFLFVCFCLFCLIVTFGWFVCVCMHVSQGCAVCMNNMSFKILAHFTFQPFTKFIWLLLGCMRDKGPYSGHSKGIVCVC